MRSVCKNAGFIIGETQGRKMNVWNGKKQGVRIRSRGLQVISHGVGMEIVVILSKHKV